MATRPAADESEGPGDPDVGEEDADDTLQPTTTRRTATIQAKRRAGRRRTFKGIAPDAVGMTALPWRVGGLAGWRCSQ
jgi:hypothetical protein